MNKKKFLWYNLAIIFIGFIVSGLIFWMSPSAPSKLAKSSELYSFVESSDLAKSVDPSEIHAFLASPELSKFLDSSSSKVVELLTSVSVTTIALGIINIILLYLPTPLRSELEKYFDDTCIRISCWLKNSDCQKIAKEDKSLAIAHPSRDTLKEKPILLKHDEVDIVGFGQSRLREEFELSNADQRDQLIKRILAGELKVRILTPQVPYKAFRIDEASPVALNQGKFEGNPKDDEVPKIQGLVDWYIGLGRELIEKHSVTLNGHAKDFLKAFEIRLHTFDLIPFYLRVKKSGASTIHFGPYIPEKGSKSTITFELPCANGNERYKTTTQLNDYFNHVWNKTPSHGLSLLEKYCDFLEKKSLPKKSQSDFDLLWDEFLQQNP